MLSKKHIGAVLGLCVLGVLSNNFSVGQDQTIKLESDLVAVDVAVLDQRGNYVTGLSEKDFVIFHDGVLQPIAFFESQMTQTLTRPLAVVFALDISASLGTQIADQQSAASRFIDLVQTHSVFAVLGFNDQVHTFQKFTSDPERVKRAFAKAKQIGGRTRLYDALDRAITMLVKDAPEWRDGRRLRRVVVVITDGFDYTSTINHREVIHRANAANVTIYSITLPSYIVSVTGKQRVPTLLDASGIVRETGGSDFSTEERDFAAIFRAIAEEIRASYLLAYYPPKEQLRDGQHHRIKVTTVRSELGVRQSRQGYQARRP
jgi:Ca-activated chloride channel family protein